MDTQLREAITVRKRTVITSRFFATGETPIEACNTFPSVQTKYIKNSARGMRARHFSFSILPRKKHRNATRPSQLKEHSTLKSLWRKTKNRSDMAGHVLSSRAAVFVLPCAVKWYRLCQA
jgi:hypothetical protein